MFREAITEEEETEEEVGQEELVEEEGAEVESVNCAPTRKSGQFARNRDRDLHVRLQRGWKVQSA